MDSYCQRTNYDKDVPSTEKREKKKKTMYIVISVVDEKNKVISTASNQPITILE